MTEFNFDDVIFESDRKMTKRILKEISLETALKSKELRTLSYLLNDGYVEVGEKFPRFAVKYKDDGRLENIFKEIEEGLYCSCDIKDYFNELYGDEL